jgi:hypothetical protein
MAFGDKALPYGLRDVKVYAIDLVTGKRTGTGVDLPAGRTFSFKTTQNHNQLEGDDIIQDSHGDAVMVDWELEAGGISIPAYKIILAGNSTATGTTPAQKITYSLKNNSQRPYFEVEGQAISESGGDVHGIVYRCKAEGDVDVSFAYATYYLTKLSGTAYGATDGSLVDWVLNETAVAVTP